MAPIPASAPPAGTGRLSLKLGRFGAFIGCSNYPECRYTRRLGVDNGDGSEADTGPKDLGQDPVTGLKVSPAQGPLWPLRPARRERRAGAGQGR